MGNKVRSDTDRAFIAERSPVPVVGYLSTSPAIIEADLRGIAVYEAAPEAVQEAQEIVRRLEQEVERSS